MSAADPAWAWAPYSPAAARPWSQAQAAHLFRRAAFGASPERLRQAVADGPQRTIDRLLAPGADLDAYEKSMAAISAPLTVSEDTSSDRCADLWLYRMMSSPWPAQEKLTLFWHDYFAIPGARVRRALLLERHLRLLRRHSLGRFDALLAALSRDPATLVALDARLNRKSQPSLLLAAAFAGRYTLGPGTASEAEILQVARAFTGAGVLRDEYRFVPQEHDPQAGTDEEALRRLLAHPATPRAIARRLYRWLVSETDAPQDALIEPLARSFARDYDIAKLAATMLRSNLFFSAAAWRRRVKSPVDLALGITAAFEAAVPAPALRTRLTQLGQHLLEPPENGWPGGKRWLNRFTAVGRANLTAWLLATLDAKHEAVRVLSEDPASAEFQLC